MFFLFTLPKERSTSDFGTFLCKIQPAPPINVITWSGFPKFIELPSLVNNTKSYAPYKYENAKTSSKEFIFLRNILDSLTEVYIRSRAVGLVPCTSYSLRTPWRLPRWCRTMRGWQEVHGRWLQLCWSNWRWRASNQRPWHQMFFLKNVIVGGNSWCRGVGHKGVMTNQLFFFCSFACRFQEAGWNLVEIYSFVGQESWASQEICWFAEWKLWKPRSDPFWQIKQQIFLVSLFHKSF